MEPWTPKLGRLSAWISPPQVGSVSLCVLTLTHFCRYACFCVVARCCRFSFFFLSGGEIQHILVHYLFALGLERSTSPYSFGGMIRWLLCSSGWLQFVICEVFISPSINHPFTSISTNLEFSRFTSVD